MTEAATNEVDEVDEIEEDVTLFTGASNNSYCPVYFNAVPAPATTLLQNSRLAFAPTLQPILELMLPFVREHTPVLA